MFAKLFCAKTDKTIIQLFRYTLVGGFAFLVDLGTLYALTEFFHIYYLLSAVFAFILGLTTNYLLSIVWVFSAHTLKSRWMEFLVFTSIGLIGLLLNELFLWFFTEIAGLYYLISKLISALIIYLWNFFIRKYFLFK